MASLARGGAAVSEEVHEALAMHTLEYAFVVGPGFVATCGSNDNFDDDESELPYATGEYLILGTIGDPMYGKAARTALWHAVSNRSNRVRLQSPCASRLASTGERSEEPSVGNMETSMLPHEVERKCDRSGAPAGNELAAGVGGSRCQSTAHGFGTTAA